MVKGAGYLILELIQVYDMLLYLFRRDSARSFLNNFVKENLKSMDGFLKKKIQRELIFLILILIIYTD